MVRDLMRRVRSFYVSIWLQTSRHLTAWISARPTAAVFGGPAVVFAVLLTPSIWMLITIPPLWKGADAYFQVTAPPGPGSILNWGPLYCFVARIPLYIGYAIDCLRAGSPFPRPAFFIDPTLTDSGVFVLLLSQHIALCCSILNFICLASRSFWVRLVLAVAWAANPLFFTLAHQVGSETLSMILLLLLAATGLRIIRHLQEPVWKQWFIFAILLYLSILTRHVNAVLAGLMPLACMLLAVIHLVIGRFTPSQRTGRWRCPKVKYTLQKATVALAIGIGCVVLANASVRVLCYATRVPYYSTVGFTFLARLKFLAALPQEKRNQLLDEVTKRTESENVEKMIWLLRESFEADASNWSVMGFMQKARLSLVPPAADPGGEQLHHLLNQMERTFLCPPQKIILSVAAADFKKSQRISIPSIVRQVFSDTTFYFSYPDRMPDFGPLSSFRDTNAEAIMTIFEQHPYFHRPKMTYRSFLLFWLVNLTLLVAIANMRKKDATGIVSLAAALTVVALFIMAANCVLNVFQPRYTFSMWELTIISASLLSARSIQYLLPPS